MFTLDRFITADGRGVAWWGVSGCRTELEKMLDEPGSPRRQVRLPTAAKEGVALVGVGGSVSWGANLHVRGNHGIAIP